MKTKIYVTILVLVSILLATGCVEQKSTNNNIGIITQTPNTSALENIKNLEKIGNNQSIELLITMFNDKDEQVQQHAMLALINIGEPVVEPLIQSLKSQSPDIRMCATIVLGKIGDKRAIEPVKQLLNDTDERVRIEAQDVYNQLTKFKNES